MRQTRSQQLEVEGLKPVDALMLRELAEHPKAKTICPNKMSDEKRLSEK